MSEKSNFFELKVLGHPAGLFVLFFTEMWERFSYYGMRALLVMFLVSPYGMGGWNWTREEAMSLYGSYTALVYITPILGGYIADKLIGYRKAVVLGAFIMTLGHTSMALEFHPAFLFLGILLLIVGNGLFKPNMTSIVSEMYRDFPDKKDGAYTIFYMGVNSGAFLGILLCGYLGEKVSWSAGFGLAGIFMLLGSIQFWLAQKIFGKIGESGNKKDSELPTSFTSEEFSTNPFTNLDKILLAISAFVGVVYAILDPINRIYKVQLLTFNGFDATNFFLILGLTAFIWLLFGRIMRFEPILRQRMWAIVAFAIFTIIFWMAFEQAGGSMTIFAKDYTNRLMTGTYAKLFMVLNALITIVPVMIISYVLFQLFKKTFKLFPISNLVLASSFIIIWFLIFWMLHRDYHSTTYNLELPNGGSTQILSIEKHQLGDSLTLLDVDKKGKYIAISTERKLEIQKKDTETGAVTQFQTGKISKIYENQVEITATWFQILNSLFIIAFAPLFSKWWESKYNPSAALKYGIGLAFLGLGFGALAFGSEGIGANSAIKASMVWLILAFLFHTLGELCISPVALSYVSKLVPGRMIAMMFGVWYVAVAIGNKLAGTLGGKIDPIIEKYSLTTFFLIFTIVPIIFGAIAWLLNPIIKKWMNGIK